MWFLGAIKSKEFPTDDQSEAHLPRNPGLLGLVLHSLATWQLLEEPSSPWHDRPPPYPLESEHVHAGLPDVHCDANHGFLCLPVWVLIVRSFKFKVWFFFTFLVSLNFFSNHKSYSTWYSVLNLSSNRLSLLSTKPALEPYYGKCGPVWQRKLCLRGGERFTGPSIIRTTSALLVRCTSPWVPAMCHPAAAWLIWSCESDRCFSCIFRRVGLFSFFLNTVIWEGCFCRWLCVLFPD